MNRAHEKCIPSANAKDGLDEELPCFYAGSFQSIPRPIKEGQRVSYVIEIDANGRRYATEIRFENDDC
jgi:hypothetical protein